MNCTVMHVLMRSLRYVLQPYMTSNGTRSHSPPAERICKQIYQLPCMPQKIWHRDTARPPAKGQT